ncbi:hypothetical protein D3875_22470 [Deinococcus cavernae]|uniref:Uncharacterized protein n=1 Tax=Deinococcus cavernae TaxID=2320857 RepID=A0A418V047_9DEIO|nr:hypothetical protein [Deinococcus cavernae]RJF69089.1 hypothetical protein D3875_22470 [Deinococcus cavernae]
MSQRVSTAELETLLTQGRYPEITEVLQGLPSLSARESALLGIALLRSGQFNRSEFPLASALARGDQEANVEYGNLLRATTQNQKAVRHFEKLLPELTGELRYRALRWYGVALYSLGDQRSIEVIEQARLGYLTLGDLGVAARIAHTLAALSMTSGDFRQAKRLLDEALPILAADQNPRPLLNAYNTLIDIQLEVGHLEGAQGVIEQATVLASRLADPYAQLQLDARQAALLVKSGDYTAFINRLNSLRERADELGEVDVYTFASNNLANHLSRTGQHAAALRVLAELTEKRPDRSLETMMVGALLTLRRGDAPNALGQLLKVRERAEGLGNRTDATKATLLAALAAYHLQDLPAALSYLTQALGELAGWPAGQARTALRQELQELEELLAHARLTPELLPVITAALEDTALLAGQHHDDLFADTQLLELNVLGAAPKVLLNGVPCELRLPYSPAVLAYLALQPQRSRQEITADLWGDHDRTKAAYSFRQCLMEIRRACRPEIIVMSGPHQEPRYALSKKVTVYLDSQRVLQLVARRDVPAAVSAYKGPFLGRLADTEWLAEHREELVRSLTFSLRSSLREAQLKGDERKVVVIASAILSIDPEDFEIEELRLETARRVSPAVEVARFQAERNKRLN